ncbi:hypothetical protein LCGC14_0975620 [marine sediment metagenome]|uniref:Uncharacterized protein n=1 Tax=marine sediment metagenome TaxID=412755 RepID=A0A0F9RGS2_9ZZZZ
MAMVQHDGRTEDIRRTLEVYLDKIVEKRENKLRFLRWLVRRDRAHWPSPTEMLAESDEE